MNMRRRLKRNVKDGVYFFCIISAIIILVISWCSDASIRNSGCAAMKTLCRISDFMADSPGQNLNIMDAFYVIWGMSITIVLFLCGLSNVYWYGITLRRIIGLSLHRYILRGGAALYVMLCPIAYAAAASKKNITFMWCVVFTFLVFCLIPLYVAYKTRKGQLIKLLDSTTRIRLQELCKLEKQGEIQGYLQMEVETLSITDMIKHIDYGDTVDISKLIKELSELFEGKDNVYSVIQNTGFRHILVQVWAEKIVECSGIETGSQRERTGYILRRLWEEITEKIGKSNDVDSESKIRLIQGYSIEILLPLLKEGTQNAAEVFRSLWVMVGNMHSQIALYLLMYLEYMHYDKEILKYNYEIFMKIICENNSRMDAFSWDIKFAVDFWLGWGILRDSGRNTALSAFQEFCLDIEARRNGQIRAMESSIIQRYVWERKKIR